jgi:hypothetical protein
MPFRTRTVTAAELSAEAGALVSAMKAAQDRMISLATDPSANPKDLRKAERRVAYLTSRARAWSAAVGPAVAAARPKGGQ